MGCSLTVATTGGSAVVFALDCDDVLLAQLVKTAHDASKPQTRIFAVKGRDIRCILAAAGEIPEIETLSDADHKPDHRAEEFYRFQMLLRDGEHQLFEL